MAKSEFQDEIDALKIKIQDDDMENSFVFYGSSSIRLWETLETDFLPRKAINLGFGGSSYGWMANYHQELLPEKIFSHIILYAGDNDHSIGLRSNHILENFRRLSYEIWSYNPATHVHVISIKPSPQRTDQITKINETNELLKASVTSSPKGHWINVHDEMLTDGKPRPELFVEDMLHMNAKGYAIWRGVLLKHFEQLGI